ncbi:MAG: isocitrate lyase/phosphoenolpyruvate mutase family protein [Bacteroidetes bacterium]|nr:isocitrate lyase/phosphoenolpyruvate mutase family protein [Bacteroidota bacterium]MBS1974958.1 isocitrate lyase/phosphoenolpyruvate mutase family protein [Bacteroidota bacterium]
MASPHHIQTGKEELFHRLHHNGRILLLPNIWDPLGAALLERLGYAAVATSSSAMSLSNGYRDGEKLPFDELLKILKRIAATVKIPVSADVETAYAASNTALKENIKKLIDTGIAGINFEDSRHDASGMLSIEEQSEKIAVVKKTSNDAGSCLFLNARVDVYIKRNDLSDSQKLAETLKRGQAYKAAGADGLYPIFVKDKKHIETIVKETGLPVNITLTSGIPDFETLESIGLARLSYASGFFKTSVFAMKNIAEKLLRGEGMDEATANIVPSDYLNGLISE